MLVVKNTFGVSTVIHPCISNHDQIDTLGGSSLNRKKYPKKEIQDIESVIVEKKEDLELPEVKERKLREMSLRSKSKIRSKVIAFSQVYPKLTFLTLTFVNQVEDKKAVNVLKKFLDNATKRFEDFQYIWIAEKQSKNQTFKDNIHFHLITNKYWSIGKWWNYWLDVQAKSGITPREEHFKPGSAFNVRLIKSDDTNSIGIYLTKYVTKNAAKFDCQVWNCSKKISRLYTCFYSTDAIIRKFERLEHAGLLDGEIKTYKKDFCNVNIIPINRLVMKMYSPIEIANRENWNLSPEKENQKP